MRNILFVFGLLGLFTSVSQAQKTVDTGQITMEITAVDSEDASVKEQMGMMKGSKTILAFNNMHSMLTMNMMEGLISMKTITTLSSGDSKMYMDAMGMKYLVPMSKTEKDKMIMEQGGDDFDKFNIEYDKSDKKEIAGYTCYKATVISKDAGPQITAYITEDIKADPKLLQGFEKFELNGFPLEYSMGDGTASMTFTATSFDTDIDKSVFDIDESEYQTMSLDEFTKMGGGIGF